MAIYNQPIPNSCRAGNILLWNKTGENITFYVGASLIEILSVNTSSAIQVNINAHQGVTAQGGVGTGGGLSGGYDNSAGYTYYYRDVGVQGPVIIPNIGDTVGDATNCVTFTGLNTSVDGQFHRGFLTAFRDGKLIMLNQHIQGGNTFDFEANGDVMFRTNCANDWTRSRLCRWDNDLSGSLQLLNQVPAEFNPVQLDT